MGTDLNEFNYLTVYGHQGSPRGKVENTIGEKIQLYGVYGTEHPRNLIMEGAQKTSLRYDLPLPS